MTTVNTTQNFDLTATETFTEAEMPALANRQFQYKEFSANKSLNAATTPAATKVYAEKLSGSQTLDLTALTRSIGAVVNATALRLQQIQISNLSTSATIVIAKGATNGYAFNGAAGDKAILPSGHYAEYFHDGLTDIDATHKTLDITGTTGQYYNVVMIFG